MSVYKDTKNNTWKVYYRFTDWQGKVHQWLSAPQLRAVEQAGPVDVSLLLRPFL